MTTLMIVSMDQGNGFAEAAFRPVPLFDMVARFGAALVAFARRVGANAKPQFARA